MYHNLILNDQVINLIIINTIVFETINISPIQELKNPARTKYFLGNREYYSSANSSYYQLAMALQTPLSLI